MLSAAKEEIVPLLAALPLSRNSHPGHQLPTMLLYPATSFTNSNTTTGLAASLYDESRRSQSTGQERDGEMVPNADFFNARYFMGVLGSFTSPDPYISETCLFDPQQWNRYSYVRNSPLALIDPTGLAATSAGASPADCDRLTKNVGLGGFNYAEANRLWNDGNLGSNVNGPVIAALAAVTWQGESNFGLTPPNNGNYIGGNLTSVDYGPFQINPTFNPNTNPSIWGTNGAGVAFNGDPDANIGFGITILEGLNRHFGNSAAGLYTGRNNPARQGRQNTYDRFKDKLQALFSNQNCFKQSPQMPGLPQPHAPARSRSNGTASSRVIYGSPIGGAGYGWDIFDLLQLFWGSQNSGDSELPRTITY